VARPIASSTAFNPAIFRMKMFFPDLAYAQDQLHVATNVYDFANPVNLVGSVRWGISLTNLRDGAAVTFAIIELVRSPRNQLSWEATGLLNTAGPVAPAMPVESAVPSERMRISYR
jgi:hypothetical protein